MENKILQFRVNFLSQRGFAHRQRRVGLMHKHGFQGRLAEKWWHSGQRLIHYTTKRIDIAAMIYFAAARLFWAHISRAADDITSLGHFLLFVLFITKHAGDAEIEKGGMQLFVFIAAKHDVAWFDVTVQYGAVVCMGKGLTN